MKKLLLLFTLFFSISVAISQNFNQPTIYNNACDANNDGIASFSIAEISFEILENYNENVYTITHHETSTDAEMGVNPLPDTYTNISPNTQTIYTRITENATGTVSFFSYQLHVNPSPIVYDQTMTICDNDNIPNDGVMFIDLGPISQTIWQSNQPGAANLMLTYYFTFSDADAGVNQIGPSGFTNTTPFSQIIYVRAQNPETGCYSIASVNFYILSCSSSCEAPTNVIASQITATTALISWTSNTGASSWSIDVTHNGINTVNISTSQNPFLMAVDCNALYTIKVNASCSSGPSAYSEAYTFVTPSCNPSAGQPTDMRQCSDTSTASFDLTTNTPIILSTLNPVDYTITYYTSETDAGSATAPIANPTNFAGVNGAVIYVRLENNTTHEYQILTFSLWVDSFSSTVIPLTDIDQCDDNNDSLVVFNLGVNLAQLNSPNGFLFYTSLANAQNQTAPIANPSAFTIGVQTPETVLFVRESVPNGCDNIYSFSARTHALCNLASVCANANPLCGALGSPFANTHQSASAETGNDYGCLGSQPNPTWFYLPVSGNGTINLKIEQNSLINFTGTGLDVDYIVYGPFDNPVAPCSGLLTAANTVSCSYSINFVEYPVIPNAVAGQYYLIMVTNYSNNAGFIKITEMPTTVGSINCSGLRLNAFLDSNNNGTQESGESNFPLGQFTYEINHSGSIHDITSPSGVYNIYDLNASNSYDLSYAIDPNYASLYNVSTASFSGIHVTGSGMTVYNFPVTVVQTYNDLAVNIVPLNSPRPGFTYQNKIVYTNNGNQTITSGTVTFNIDPQVTIVSNSQSGTTSTTNGFTYNFTNLLPFESRSMTVVMQVPTIPTVAIGGLLVNTASVAPLTDDVVPINNSASMTQIITGSYDPNDKMESHGGKILYSSFTSDDYLLYTIHFENTGTASAVNVRVNDVLDSRLDENSIKMINASHPYILDRLNNVLNWKFENIQLPVSVDNSTIGKGYVSFKIKPKSGYSVGDIIPNTASIYFDFNPAIVTNTFNTEFVAQLGLNQFENGDFVFYPNPVSDRVTISLKNNGTITTILVYDVLGKVIASQKPSGSVSSQTVDLSSIAKGVYLLEVTSDSNLKVIKKLLVE
ncbi:MAG TPA: T9SS type A sorting domain-containing protein [Flavobacterium sp.]|uniref:DUF7619 domain-containing protein n=1 Tax=Flavobacterium sp. TaxID=239 RepID=UPI002CAB9FBB|nr:T9SS type A sorting domain-containing protein [Flavobacterium sp.]HNP31787.1 T9SS type A sorting domain-containing protein [Flavobacterium sp.]